MDASPHEARDIESVLDVVIDSYVGESVACKEFTGRIKEEAIARKPRPTS